jgi:glycosyltransferase involved in cell wall biosynthesis
MNNRKIAIIVQRFGKEINGGAEVHARMIAEKLKNKYEVTVLTSRAIDYQTWEPVLPEGETVENDIKIIRFDHPRKSNKRAIRLFNKRVLNRAWYQKIYRFIGEPKWYLKLFPETIVTEEDEKFFFDIQGPTLHKLPSYLLENQSKYLCFVFFTYLYYPTAIGMPNVGHKSIFIPTIHDEPPIYLPVFKKIIPTAKWIFFNTITERKFSETLFGLEYNKKETVAVGINPIAYVHDPIIEEKYAKCDSYILYVGRIDKGKGCDRLINYFIKFSNSEETNLKLVMVGNLYMNRINHPNIIYTGFVSENEKNYLIRSALFLAIPSRFESLALVLLESFALKTPVVINEHCDVLKEHIIQSGGGLSFLNYLQFKEAILFFKKNSDLKILMGNKGYNYALNNYCWESVMNKFDIAIKDIQST